MSGHYKNEVEEILVKAVRWIKSNKQLFFTVAGTLAAIVILGILIHTRYQAVLARAADKFSAAQGMYSQGMGEQSERLLREVIVQYPRSSSASQSRLLLSEILLNQKRFEEAVQLSREVYEKGKPSSLRPFALNIVISALVESGSFQEALANCNLFIEKYPEHFLTPRIYGMIAFAYESQGMLTEAKQTYEKIITLYPGSTWAEKARINLNNHGAQQ